MRKFLPHFSLTTKVFLICSSLALIVTIGGSAVLYREACYSLRQEVRAKLMGIAATAALQVDPELHKKIKTNKDARTPGYRKVLGTLIAIQNSNPDIIYVYTMRKSNDKNALQFIVDVPDPDEPKYNTHVGEKYDITGCSEILKGFNGPAADKEPVSDKWGRLISGYAPIRDRNGKVDGILAIDMALPQLKIEERALRIAAVKTILVALLLSIALSWIITRGTLKKVRIFTKAAQRVKNGDLDFRLPVKSHDEIGQFTEAFNHMMTGLQQTVKDFLTGLFNHRYFQERLTTELVRAERYNHNLCLLIFDLDRFKSINDTLGHPAGDSVLKQLAEVVKDSIRSIDVAARYGGDEFAIILPETDLESGMEVAERLRRAVEEKEFCIPAGESASDSSQKTINATITIGLAVFPDHHRTREGLIMAADIALCRAKHVSRNSTCAYDPVVCGNDQVDPHDLYQMLSDPDSSMIRSLSAAVDARDRYTCGHSERVTNYAVRIGEAIGVAADVIAGLRVAGQLHDIGKVGVPDSVLSKPGSLTNEERQAVQSHPSIGEKILRRAPHIDLIIPAVLFHHERWDGAGYPDGLSGESIPLMARIISIADAFDAMTTDRPYRKALSVQHALLELRANAGKQFDPALVELFISAISSDAQIGAA
ncbi:MAG: diguanylate cyclase [Armatimonadota bacterium]